MILNIGLAPAPFLNLKFSFSEGRRTAKALKEVTSWTLKTEKLLKLIIYQIKILSIRELSCIGITRSMLMGMKMILLTYLISK